MDVGLYGEDSPPTEFRASPPHSPVNRKSNVGDNSSFGSTRQSSFGKAQGIKETVLQRQERYKGENCVSSAF